MATLFGTTMKKQDILERVGDISQLCDARTMEYTDGRAAGVKAIEVTTGSGLSLTVLPSRCLDISRASFRGIPIAWLSAVGETSPYFYQPEDLEFLRGFFGGLLTTCGLTYSSHPCEDDGEKLGLHGRAANIPAENVSVTKWWDGDDYRISITGRVREVKVYGHNLVLTRTIETSLGSKSIRLQDTITNAGYRKSPLMMLYHINPGWPVVSENSRLVAPVKSSKGFSALSDTEIDQWSTFLPPRPDYEERVYLHDMAADGSGMVGLALVNEPREIGVYMKYPKKEFPCFLQWKQMGQGEYVCGIEPGNITGHRAQMRADGTLEFIEPGAERVFSIELGVLYGKDELSAFIHNVEETAS